MLRYLYERIHRDPKLPRNNRQCCVALAARAPPTAAFSIITGREGGADGADGAPIEHTGTAGGGTVAFSDGAVIKGRGAAASSGGSVTKGRAPASSADVDECMLLEARMLQWTYVCLTRV